MKKNDLVKGNIFLISFLVLTFVLFLQPEFLSAQTTSVPATGQTTSYFAGDDGSLQKGVSWPSPRFTITGQGTVLDNLTGLVWLQNGMCSGRQNWSDALASAATLSTNECNLFDGSDEGDWRMPNIREIESLVHSGVFFPSVPNSLGSGKATVGNPFFNLETVSSYWSSTSNTSSPENAFSINFSHGERNTEPKSASNYTLYVRNANESLAVAMPYATGQRQCYQNDNTVSCSDTGQDGEQQAGKEWPIPRFKDLGNGVVQDNLTNLFWLKNADCASPGLWINSFSFINNLADGICDLTDSSRPGDWRLPNRNELSSLIDFGNHSPALSDTTGTGPWSNGDPFFNVNTTAGFWTSTTHAEYTGQAWYINLQNGTADAGLKNTLLNFWPVRGDLVDTLSVEIQGGDTAVITSSPPGITCPGTCSYEFTRDSIVTLSIDLPDGSQFKGWSIDGCDTNPTCEITVAGTTTVIAYIFERQTTVSPWLLLLKE